MLSHSPFTVDVKNIPSVNWHRVGFVTLWLVDVLKTLELYPLRNVMSLFFNFVCYFTPLQSNYFSRI